MAVGCLSKSWGQWGMQTSFQLMVIAPPCGAFALILLPRGQKNVKIVWAPCNIVTDGPSGMAFISAQNDVFLGYVTPVVKNLRMIYVHVAFICITYTYLSRTAHIIAFAVVRLY